MKTFIIWSWTITAAFGVVISLYAFWDASRDVAYAERWTHRETRFLTAVSHMRRELLRTIIQLMYLGLGTAYVLNPNPPENAVQRTAGTFVLVVGCVLIVLNTLFDVLARRKINRSIDEQETETKRQVNKARDRRKGDRA